MVSIWNADKFDNEVSAFSVNISETFRVQLLLGKTILKEPTGNGYDPVQNMKAVLMKKLQRPFTYRRRNREVNVDGVQSSFLDWFQLQDMNENKKNSSELEMKNVVFIMDITISHKPATYVASSHRSRASRHLHRLVNRCGCHILNAKRTQLKIFLPAEENSGIVLDLNRIPEEGSYRWLSEDEEAAFLNIVRKLETHSKLHQCRAFVMHKPLRVVSSTVDTDIKQDDEDDADDSSKDCNEPVGGRPTVYDVAAAAGFPRDCSLVGRLDADTSGLMFFTDNSQLARAVRDPIAASSADSSLKRFKAKEYALLMLPGKKVLKNRR